MKIDPEEVAAHLNSLTPYERQLFISVMRSEAVFCWFCYCDDGGRQCQCMNDE